MGYKYGHKATALNGILKYIQSRYPESKLLKTLVEGIPEDQRHARANFKGINEFLKGYRLSRGSNPSNTVEKNAQYIQNNFKPFAEYCKLKLK